MADRCIMTVLQPEPPLPFGSTIRTGAYIYLMEGNGNVPSLYRYDKATMTYDTTITVSIAPDTRFGSMAVGKGYVYYFDSSLDLIQADVVTGAATNLGDYFFSLFGFNVNSSRQIVRDENRESFLMFCHDGAENVGCIRVNKATGLVSDFATHFVTPTSFTIGKLATVFPLNGRWYVGGNNAGFPAVGFSEDLQTLYQDMTDILTPSLAFDRGSYGPLSAYKEELDGTVQLFSGDYDSDVNRAIVDYTTKPVVDTVYYTVDTEAAWNAGGNWLDPNIRGCIFDGTDMYFISEWQYTTPATSAIIKVNPDTLAYIADAGTAFATLYSLTAAMDWE